MKKTKWGTRTIILLEEMRKMVMGRKRKVSGILKGMVKIFMMSLQIRYCRHESKEIKIVGAAWLEI